MMKLLFENWRKFVNEACCPDKVPGASVDLRLKPSEIHGKGIFAGEKILKGTDLGTSHIRKNGMWTIPDLGRWHNHSDNPSCHNTLDGSMEDKTYTRNLIASRDIEPGEEITVNYRLQPDLEQPGQWAINETPAAFLTKTAGKGLDARTTSQGVEEDDHIMTALGLAGLVVSSPFQAAAITIGTLTYGNAKRAYKEWESLPEDHPRKVAHKRYVQQCPNCHRLDGKSREWHEKNKGATHKKFSTLGYFKDQLRPGQKIKADEKQRKHALELMKMWLNK